MYRSARPSPLPSCTARAPVKRRIMDMGLTKGTEVYVRKVAPLGDPMELTVRGYELQRTQGATPK